MSREAIKCVPFSAQEHQRVIEFEDRPRKDEEKHRGETKKWIKTKIPKRNKSLSTLNRIFNHLLFWHLLFLTVLVTF